MDYFNKLRNNLGKAVSQTFQNVAQSAPVQFGQNLVNQAAPTLQRAFPIDIAGTPQRAQMVRQTVENYTKPVQQFTGNLIQRAPSQIFPSLMPNVLPSELTRPVFKMATESVLNTPASWARGVEFAVSPQRRQFISQQDLPTQLMALGDVAGVLPWGTAGKVAAPVLKTGIAGLNSVGQVGKLQLGPKIGQTIPKLAGAGDEVFNQRFQDYAKNAFGKVGDVFEEAPIAPPQLPQLNIGNKIPELPAKPTKGLGQDIFADWVNNRRATDIESKIASSNFKDLDDQGMKAFFEIQSGNKQGRFGEVRGFLDKKFKQAQDAGIPINYKEDYLTQAWDNTPEEVSKVFGKRVTSRPGFTMEQIVDDYKTGIEAGLKPKFEKVSDLLGHYEGKVNKAIADRQFFTQLQKENLILPAKEAPDGWRTVNYDRFPRMKGVVNGMEQNIEGPFKAPPELATKIEHYLFDPKTDGSNFSKGLANVADYVSRVKNVTLSFGIPGTAINSHGINILARHTIFGQGGNMLTRFLKGGNYLVNQYSSGKQLAKITPEIPQAVKRGLTIGVEDRKNVLEATGLRSKFGEGWSKLFEEALFDKMLPTLKYDSYKAVVKDFAKKMPQEQAEKEAAKLVNNIYGGVNWEQMGRDRNLQNAIRSLILAPDWAETTLRLGGNFAKAIKNPNSPVARKYQNMMAGLLTAYIGANVANKLSSGKFMWENDSGHTFEIEAGYTEDGQKRYIRPFGTAMDMARLPYDIVLSLAKGDLTGPSRVIRNRLSIPAGVVYGYASDVDYRGQPIGWRGKDKYGNEMPAGQRAANVGTEIASFIGVPNFVKQFAKGAAGQQGVEQSLSQGFELPFRYSGGAFSKSQKHVEGIGKAEGLKGKDLYDLNEKTRGISLTDNQKELLNQGGLGMLEPLMQLKLANSQKNQVKNVFQKVEQGQMSEEEAEKEVQKILNTPDAKQPTSKVTETGTVQAAETKSIQALKIQDTLTKTKVEATGEPVEKDGKYYYPDPETGNAKVVDLNPTVEPFKPTGDAVIDKELKSDYKGEISKAVNDNIELYKLGKITQQELRTRIDALKGLTGTGGSGGTSIKKAVSIAKRFTVKKSKSTPFKSLKLYSKKTVSAPKIPTLRSNMPEFKSQLKPFKLKKPKSMGKKLNIPQYL